MKRWVSFGFVSALFLSTGCLQPSGGVPPKKHDPSQGAVEDGECEAASERETGWEDSRGGSSPSERESGRDDPTGEETDPRYDLVSETPEWDEIRSLLDESNCLGCHEDYADYDTAAAASGAIVFRIGLESGERGFMPQGGETLNPDVVESFRLWDEAGAPESPVDADARASTQPGASPSGGTAVDEDC